MRSLHTAFANIRQLVLEVSFAEESKKWLATAEERYNENDNSSNERIPSPISLPKVVGIGLETVFQLVKESHSKHSSFCVKALEALLHILGGQYPQSLRKEPIPVIDSLFATLLSLSKEGEEFDTPNSSSKAQARLSSASSSSSSLASEQLTSLATACLISLAIARGETKMMLEAISSLFICPENLAMQTFEVSAQFFG